MVFDVLNPLGLAVPDPDDPARVLGSIELKKATVRVTEVRENLALASTFRTREITTFPILLEIPELFRPTRTVVERLPIEGGAKDQRSVLVGDAVMEVLDQETPSDDSRDA